MVSPGAFSGGETRFLDSVRTMLKQVSRRDSPKGMTVAKREKAAVVESYLKEGASIRVSALALTPEILKASEIIAESFRRGGKLMTFGNGGSASDAQHIAAEFAGRFASDRAPLPALALTANSSAVTAIANDYAFEDIFARQVLAFAKTDDVVMGISTSGKSANVLKGLAVARESGARTIGLTGQGGSMLKYSDVLLAVPSRTASLVQEVHIAIGHILCLLVEEELFG